MNKERLTRLADYLKKIDAKDYTITSYAKDALWHAAHVPEFKKAGLRLTEQDNSPGLPVVVYKHATDIAAACLFFGINDIQAQYLFGQVEIDITGKVHKAPCVSARDSGSSRDTEWPTWTAARIECFVRDPSVDYLDRVKKAA